MPPHCCEGVVSLKGKECRLILLHKGSWEYLTRMGVTYCAIQRTREEPENEATCMYNYNPDVKGQITYHVQKGHSWQSTGKKN